MGVAGRRGREPNDVAKIGIGSLLTGLSALLFVAGALLPGADGKTSVLWALAGYFGMGVAFLYYWPVLLALISQAAPAKLNATMMGGVFLSLFAGIGDRGLGRQFLRPDEPGGILVDRCGDRDRRRADRAGAGAAARSVRWSRRLTQISDMAAART